jgi:hypothetical protein
MRIKFVGKTVGDNDAPGLPVVYETKINPDVVLNLIDNMVEGYSRKSENLQKIHDMIFAGTVVITAVVITSEETASCVTAVTP